MYMHLFVNFAYFRKKIRRMVKEKLIELRKAKGLSQNDVAEKLCMDVSSYSRRENGQIKINHREWEKLAKMLEVPVNEIFESDEAPIFICKDNAAGNYMGTNHIYSVPDYLLETQRKYIDYLEQLNKNLREENNRLKKK
jgi:transcriptional regulator with XRE-family HTH domain